MGNRPDSLTQNTEELSSQYIFAILPDGSQWLACTPLAQPSALGEYSIGTQKKPWACLAGVVMKKFPREFGTSCPVPSQSLCHSHDLMGVHLTRVSGDPVSSARKCNPE
jgi:hypothetical protein